ncbi:GTPase IMAP family member 8-like [Gouania willdenowi]|uniref:GTPase IMAP family member 8-like n=1 Tax=Gouania willdenowi TaxID=441366 RepID=A0A8C5I875_GOUWI|nr:GTPase IMAP family member 8-like [Gouania willdenowi]
MSQKSMTSTGNMTVVLSMEEQWSTLTSLLQKSSKSHQSTLSSAESNQVCELTVEGHFIKLCCAGLNQDMTEESMSLAVDRCFRSFLDGHSAFLLLIQGGHYTQEERRMIQMLQVHFGAEALQYLVILSVEVGKFVDTLDDDLLDLIKVCEGRFCSVTSSAVSDGLHCLLEMLESVGSGYTENMLSAARERSSEDSALDILKENLRHAEEKERAFKQLLDQQEAARVREMDALKAKHAAERKREAAEKKQLEEKRQRQEEALMCHRAMTKINTITPPGNITQKTSVIMLGLSGCGKTSALNLILQRAGSQYSAHRSVYEPAHPTLFCERKEVLAAGTRLILVDTPELWDEDEVENVELVKDCLALALPGPHVFLLVLQVGRFTQGECDMLGHLQRIFGREFAEHAVILFVQFDCGQKKPQMINDYVAGAHSALQELVRKCGSRFYELIITKSLNALSYPQVKDLLSGITKLVASHGEQPYSVRRFTVQELQERSKMLVEGKEVGLEVNYLLRDE